MPYRVKKYYYKHGNRSTLYIYFDVCFFLFSNKTTAFSQLLFSYGHIHWLAYYIKQKFVFFLFQMMIWSFCLFDFPHKYFASVLLMVEAMYTLTGRLVVNTQWVSVMVLQRYSLKPTERLVIKIFSLKLSSERQIYRQQQKYWKILPSTRGKLLLKTEWPDVEFPWLME